MASALHATDENGRSENRIVRREGGREREGDGERESERDSESVTHINTTESEIHVVAPEGKTALSDRQELAFRTTK